jgi:hypothetical protein
MLKKLTPIAAAVVLSGALAGSASASVLHLALVLDGSGSISPSDYSLQLNGYRNVFTDSNFFTDFVDPSPFDSLNVAVYQFSTTVVQEVGFTSITDQASAVTFGNLFNTTEMPQLDDLTNTDDAIRTATAGLAGITLGVDDKMVMDISTDGLPNVCQGGTGTSSSLNNCGGESAATVAIAAADLARDAGITVNALGVGSSIGTTFLTNLVDGTPDGFFLTADSFDEFAGTIRTKLGREITGEVPAPATLALLGLGVAGIGFARNRKSKAA